MSGKVWMSGILGNQDLGYKQGTRSKLYGRDWDLETGLVAPHGSEYVAGVQRYARGFSLKREEMPEACAVANETYFKNVGDIFPEGGIFVVRGKLAEILAHFDLGTGGLVPLPFYKADLVTPYCGEFFLLNFGARKNTLIPEASSNLQKFFVQKDTGRQFWKIYDGSVALSPKALAGPDLWVEEDLYNKVFLSDSLAQALIDAKLDKDWRLTPCAVLESGQ